MLFWNSVNIFTQFVGFSGDVSETMTPWTLILLEGWIWLTTPAVFFFLPPPRFLKALPFRLKFLKHLIPPETLALLTLLSLCGVVKLPNILSWFSKELLLELVLKWLPMYSSVSSSVSYSKSDPELERPSCSMLSSGSISFLLLELTERPSCWWLTVGTGST